MTRGRRASNGAKRQQTTAGATAASQSGQRPANPAKAGKAAATKPDRQAPARKQAVSAAAVAQPDRPASVVGAADTAGPMAQRDARPAVRPQLDVGRSPAFATSPTPLTSSTVSLSDFFGLLGRRAVTFVVTFVLVFLAALALFFTTTRTYNAESTIKVAPVTVLGDNPTKGISTVTESRIVTSTRVAAIAARTLGYTGRTDELLSNVSTTSPLDSQLIYVTFSGESARDAAEGANAFANAYLTYRTTVAQANLADQAKKVAAQIAALQKELSALPTSTSAGQRSALQSQIDGLNNDLYSINTTLVSPGQVVGTAQPPTSPTSPRAILYLAGGALGGIILGIVVAVVRDRRDDGLHGEDDLAAAIGAPVLATVAPSEGSRSNDLAFGPGGDAARRAEVDAYRATATKLRTTAGDGATQRFLVTRSGRAVRPRAALNLAAMFARQGKQAVLVVSDGSAPVVGPFLDEGRMPTSLDDGLRTVPNADGLSVLFLGPEDQIDSVLTVRGGDIAAALSDADVVVVDAVNVEYASTVLTLGQLASSAVITAVDRRTTHAELNRVSVDLNQVGALPVGGMLFLRDSAVRTARRWLYRGSRRTS